MLGQFTLLMPLMRMVLSQKEGILVTLLSMRGKWFMMLNNFSFPIRSNI